MKKYKKLFSSLHTLYRLTTSFNRPEDFLIGVGKLYKSTFDADDVVIVCKCFNTKLIKVKINPKRNTIIKGGISVLTKREKEVLEKNKEIALDKKMASSFIFLETLGIVIVEKKKEAFTPLEKKWFTLLTEQISICFKIINLYFEEQKMILSYIKALSKILNEFVPTSYINYKGLSKLINILGKEMKLTDSETRSLKFATLLHDAGKLHLPSKILKKQEPLTEEEFKMIMKHPKKGVELIKDLESLKPVIPIILHHHERFDGKGYPSGLKKNQIPLGSRILAVLDAFDAMFFGRPYKKKMSLEEIEKELKKQRGIQFDPKVVDVFLKVLRKKNVRKYLHSLV